jgi:predicted transcriptional regulator
MMSKKIKRASHTVYLPTAMMLKVGEIASALNVTSSVVIEKSLVAVIDNPASEAIQYLKEIEPDDAIERISRRIYHKA